jgi:uncharacterized protein (TIGR02646 family)
LLFFEKSQPAPECLAQEKGKQSGNYKCGDVLSRLQADFKNKCYICETQAPISVNVEHFRPHKGDRDLMFDWNNLFWACGHCNNTKLAKYGDILDCTNSGDRIEEKLKYSFKPFPHEMVSIETLDQDANTESTKALVLAVFNGTTDLKQLEAANLRNQLLREIRDFQNHLCDYFEPTFTSEEKAHLHRKIRSHLNEASSFTSFKRWIIRENDRLKQEFHDCL